MIYPRKRKATFGLDLSQLKLQDQLTENASSISGAGQLAGGLIKKAGTKDLGYGVQDTAGAASYLGSQINGAAKGLEIGSNFGPMGAMVGAGIGGAVGSVTGAIDAFKNDKNSAFRKRDAREMDAVIDQNKQGVSAYNALEQKQFEDGGEIPDGTDQQTSEEAVILGGKRHSKGGNDILDEAGNKVAETEREELLFTKEQTQMIETSIKKINDGDETEYTNLGAYVKDIILNRTKDNSGKFKELNDAVIS
jgi:hypothetical protein